MRAANGKHYALVIKRTESGVWVVGLRGHLVSEREVNNPGSVLSESRPVSAVARSSLLGWGGGDMHTARYVGRM